MAAACYFAVIFLVLFSCTFDQIHATKWRPRNQADSLNQLRKDQKLRKGSAIESDDLFGGEKKADMAAAKLLPQDGMKKTDRIDKLPGQPQVEFDQYGGYVTVDESSGRAFFYYFAEASSEKKDSLPLLLWLNGGPGCSSLGYGAMAELGPFRVHTDGKTLFKNKFAWNNAANVLFLESPAGVGFSYSNTTSDYASNGDASTAEDNYVFMVNWLERFPEYKHRDLYIAGESYAGHYVPQLAHTIVQNNKNPNNPTVNLKGIMIGNAVINDEADVQGMYDYFGTHALISEQLTRKIQKECNFSPSAKISDECSAAISKANRVFDDQIDIYNIYAPLCRDGNLTTKPTKASVIRYDPCTDYYVYAYLNRPTVQKALHANVTKLDHDWQPCSDVITDWQDSATTVIPILQELMDNECRVWVFSGDIDGRVPVTSSQYSFDKMNLKIKNAWNTWYLKREVGGYSQVYEKNLTFVTIRGAGHMVPSYQPVRALSLIKHFLAGTLLPSY